MKDEYQVLQAWTLMLGVTLRAQASQDQRLNSSSMQMATLSGKIFCKLGFEEADSEHI
jgi:hypothetical protein